MPFESTLKLLSDLIRQQRETEVLTQTPQFQAAVDQLFANRIEFARNQLLYDRLSQAKNADEVWEAIKTVKPEQYVQYRKQKAVESQILDLLRQYPEQKRDYGLINFLASTVGYGDVGPIEQRPIPQERFAQELQLRRYESGGRYYEGRPDLSLRRQREALFSEFLDRGILYKGKPAAEQQKEQLQKQYLETGIIPKEFDIMPKPTKEAAPQRPTRDQMVKAYEQAITLIKKEKGKLGTAKESIFLGMGIDVEDTFKNLLALSDEEINKLKISNRLKNFIKLFKMYGLPEDYLEEGQIEPSAYLQKFAAPDNDPLRILE